MATETINNQSEDGSPTTDDFVPTWDVGTASMKKSTIANILALIRSGGSGYALSSFTSTISGSGSALGTGTMTAKCVRIGNLYEVQFRFLLGGTSTVGSNFSMALPTTADVTVLSTANNHIGSGEYRDSSTGNLYPFFIRLESSTTARVIWLDAAATETTTIPAAAATNDSLAGSYRFVAA